MITYEEATGQLIIAELLHLDLGVPPTSRQVEVEARRAARQEAQERAHRLSTALAYSAYGRGLEWALEAEERLQRLQRRGVRW